jgi:hypothetical protein
VVCIKSVITSGLAISRTPTTRSRWTTIATGCLLAAIAAPVSYFHVLAAAELAGTVPPLALVHSWGTDLAAPALDERGLILAAFASTVVGTKPLPALPRKRPAMPDEPVLTLRALNRTLLQRQFLLQRTNRSALEVIEHLVAMQGQDPNWPYVGLWTRKTSFGHDDLTALLHDRSVVRSTMVRATQHLASAADFAWLRPAVQPLLDRHVRASYYTEQLGDLNLDEVVKTALEFLGDRAVPRRDLSRMLTERYPGRKGAPLAGAVEVRTPLVHPAPGCTWGSWWSRPSVPVAQAQAWTGRPMDSGPGIERLILRCLAAFGPATVHDAKTWSGLNLREIRPAVEELRPQLRSYRDEQGRELLDLAAAPLADAEAPAPARFLPAYDNAILSHADRSRIIAAEDRPKVVDGAVVEPTFLIDGFVAGTWVLEGPVVRIRPFAPLAEDDAAHLHAEAERLAPFLAPGGEAPRVEMA